MQIILWAEETSTYSWSRFCKLPAIGKQLKSLPHGVQGLTADLRGGRQVLQLHHIGPPIALDDPLLFVTKLLVKTEVNMVKYTFIYGLINRIRTFDKEHNISNLTNTTYLEIKLVILLVILQGNV